MSVQIGPCIYDVSIAKWRMVRPSDPVEELQQGQVLRIVSWNVDFSNADPSSRMTTLLGHIQEVFSNTERRLVIFFQEVCHESLQRILKTEWVSRNFNIVGLPPPMVLQNGMKRPAGYFNLILIPRGCPIKNSWRLNLPSRMGRNALFVDISRKALTEDAGDEGGTVRLCTTHLESLGPGLALRKKQLELISQYLKQDDFVTCGVVGGDFNSIEDHENSEPTKMGLTDAWSEPSEPTSEGSMQIANSHGRKEGHTWGYQSPGTRYPPRRFDKFLFAGDIEIVPACGSNGQTEMVQRLGINLKTDPNIAGPFKPGEDTGSTWVSDHFGIAIEVRIV